MKVICVLQNAWGSGRLPLIFSPNEMNKSAKTIRKKVLVDTDRMHFCNTTSVVTATAAGKAKYDEKHFKQVIDHFGRYDLILVCGNQAQAAVNLHLQRIMEYGKPIVFMPHPASRSLSNIQLEAIRSEVDQYRSNGK